MNLLSTARYIVKHPLSRGRRLANLGRFIAWQVGSRLVPGPVAIALTNKARLFAEPGMTSATGHIYVGLQEFEDMAFVAHALRPGDLFVDVGANIGAYTALAGAVAGAAVMAFEPNDLARDWLARNVALNGLQARVEIRNEAVGATAGNVEFTVDRDTTNSVVVAGDGLAVAERKATVPMTTLDIMCQKRCPAIIKIDVEGFELPVIEGASELLSHSGLLALVVEMNGSGAKYGFDESKLVSLLGARGFEPMMYRPEERKLVARSDASSHASDNVIFARKSSFLDHLLRDAEQLNIQGRRV